MAFNAPGCREIRIRSSGAPRLSSAAVTLRPNFPDAPVIAIRVMRLRSGGEAQATSPRHQIYADGNPSGTGIVETSTFSLRFSSKYGNRDTTARIFFCRVPGSPQSTKTSVPSSA